MNTDKISYLPDSIRRRILSFLPIEDITRLTTLSTKWRTLRSSLTHFDFNQLNFPKTQFHQLEFKHFVYQTLLQHTSTDLNSFKLALHVDRFCTIDINTWIIFAIRHKVQQLHLSVLSGKFENLPNCLFTSKTLSILCLENITLKLPRIFRKFENLRKLSLVSVKFLSDEEAIKLFSSCPLLEELSIVSCYFNNLVDVFRFPAPNLKFLKVLGLSRFHEIELDFPNLRQIVYSGRPPRISLETLSSLYKAEFHLTIPPPNPNGEDREDRDLIDHRASKILEGLSNVCRLTLEGVCIEFFTRDLDLLARLPTSYSSLDHLKLELYPDKNQVEVVMSLLRRFPNLRTLCISIKTLTLTNMVKIRGHREPHESTTSTECILKCLRKVDIKYFGGSKSELALVNFLLENGIFMEEMNISYSKHKQTDKTRGEVINKTIATFTKASPKVAVYFS